MLIKWRLCGINVKARAKTEIISGLRIVGNALTTRAGVRRDKDQTQFRTCTPKFTLLGHIGMGARQARQKPDDGQHRALFMWRHIDRKCHVGARCRRCVAIHALNAAKRNVGGHSFYGHAGSNIGIVLIKGGWCQKVSARTRSSGARPRVALLRSG